LSSKHCEDWHQCERFALITTKADWAASLPLSDLVEVGGHAIYVLHNLSELAPDPAASNFTAIISGHSHKPVVKKQGMILFINPTALVPDASPCR
jgi:predicted phosphodiesterase